MRELNEQLRRANAECKSRRDELERLNDELAPPTPNCASWKMCAPSSRC